MHFTCIEINKASQSQRKRYKNNKCELVSLRKRWKERREAYERSVVEIEQSKKQELHNSRLADSVDVKNQHKKDSGDVSEQIDDYSTLQQSLLNEVMQSSPSPSPSPSLAAINIAPFYYSNHLLSKMWEC